MRAGNSSFIFQIHQVFCSHFIISTPLEGADAASFELIGSDYNEHDREDRFAKDKNYVYERCKILEGISPDGFESLFGSDVIKIKEEIYYAKYNDWILLEGLNPDQTVVEKLTPLTQPQYSGLIIKDQNIAYYRYASNRDPFMIPKVDPLSFQLLNRSFAKDKNYVYFIYHDSFNEHFKILQGADPHSFELGEKETEARDKNNFYSYIDSSFEVKAFPNNTPLPICYFLGSED